MAGGWAPAGLLPQRPEAMAEWRRARQAVLGLAAAEREAAQARDALAARREAARAALAGLLPAAPAGTALAPLLAAADDACATAEAAVAAHRKLVEKHADEEARLPEARDRAEAAERALAELDADWAAVATALGLASGAGAAEVEAALGAWTRIAEAVPAWRTDAQRIADMEAEVEGFAAALRDILARLPGADTGEPPVVLALGLGAGWRRRGRRGTMRRRWPRGSRGMRRGRGGGAAPGGGGARHRGAARGRRRGGCGGARGDDRRGRRDWNR